MVRVINQYILFAGRTLPVVALVKQNGIPHVCVMEAPDRPRLVPLAVAQAAPGRSRPVLVVDNSKQGE